MHRHGQGWGSGQCGCNCCGPGYFGPISRDEAVDELQDYKASLESEIAALEKRIQALKERKE